MSFKFNFCRDCGAPAKDEWMGMYNPETGEKIMRSICSANRCHTIHDWTRQKFFARGDKKCQACGKIAYYCSGIFG